MLHRLCCSSGLVHDRDVAPRGISRGSETGHTLAAFVQWSLRVSVHHADRLGHAVRFGRPCGHSHRAGRPQQAMLLSSSPKRMKQLSRLQHARCDGSAPCKHVAGKLPADRPIKADRCSALPVFVAAHR